MVLMGRAAGSQLKITVVLASLQERAEAHWDGSISRGLLLPSGWSHHRAANQAATAANQAAPLRPAAIIHAGSRAMPWLRHWHTGQVGSLVQRADSEEGKPKAKSHHHCLASLPGSLPWCLSCDREREWTSGKQGATWLRKQMPATRCRQAMPSPRSADRDEHRLEAGESACRLVSDQQLFSAFCTR